MLTAVLLACARNHAPEIVALDLTPSLIFPGDEVEARIEVADRDGALDLVAGWIEVEGVEVARFEAGGVAGTFAASLPGEALLARIDDFDGEGALKITAVVTDTAGEEARRTRSLRLTCGPDESFCGGRCVDLASDPLHCGECGAACDEFEVCDDAECVGGAGWTPCERQTSATIDCDATCGALGLVCATGCGRDEVWEDNWARYAASAEVCEGEGSGTAFAPIWDGGNCVAPAGALEPPIWVSCCCLPL